MDTNNEKAKANNNQQLPVTIDRARFELMT